MKSRQKTALIFLTVVYSLPYTIIFIGSLFYNNRLSLMQYVELFVNNYPFFTFFCNSLLYSVLGACISIILALPIAYMFAKINFRFRDTLFFFYILAMMLPFQATMLPQYIVLRDLNFLNTRIGLVLWLIFSPTPVFLLRQFIKSIPDEIIDSAKLETSSPITILTKIIIPQIKPALFTLLILTFCEGWNMYEQALIFAMQNQKIQPLTTVIMQLPENVAFSGATIYTIPVLILFLLFEKSIYSGMERYKW